MRRLFFLLLFIGAGVVALTGHGRESALVLAAYPMAILRDLAHQHITLTTPPTLLSPAAYLAPGIHARYVAMSAQDQRIALATAGLLLAALAWTTHRVRRRAPLRLGRSAGSAGWGRWYAWWTLHIRRRETPFVLGRLGPLGLGPLLGIRERDQARNAILWGPPGYGKTRIIIENLLRLLRSIHRLPSLTITDSKGAIYAAVGGHLHRQGYQIIRIDWLDATADGYNPLDPCHIKEPADAFAWAESLIANTGRNTDTPFWDDTTTLLLVATVLTLKAHDGHVTPRAVQQFLAQPIPVVKEALRHSDDPAAREAATGMLAYMAGNERLEGSVFSGPPLKFMSLWQETIAETTSRNSVNWADLADPTKPPVAVFVTLTPGYERLLRPFVGTLFDQMNTELLRIANSQPGTRKELPRRVMNWWDEAGTIGRLTDLPARLNTSREAGIGTVLGAQSTTQFDMLYTPQGREIILQGCYAHIILPGLRAEQADAVATELGQATVAQQQGGASRQGNDLLFRDRSIGLSETGRSLLTADEVRRLWTPQLLAVVGNKRPVKLWWGGHWWWSPVLRRRAGLVPPAPLPPPPPLPPLPATGPTSPLLIDWGSYDGQP